MLAHLIQEFGFAKLHGESAALAKRPQSMINRILQSIEPF
jgi:hypothetical protein